SAPRLAGRLEAIPPPAWARDTSPRTTLVRVRVRSEVSVRTLPDSPNLEHLRHQAKDLLAGLRGSDPTATLAYAQASLAEQYGFRSWTDLKAEVDRRQGRADVADP